MRNAPGAAGEGRAEGRVRPAKARRVAAIAAAAAGATAATAAALLMFAVPAAAQSFEVRRLAFLPTSYGAGEPVEAILQVSPEGAEPRPFTLRVGEGLPEPGQAADPELREVRLQKSGGGYELRYLFVPWSPGPGQIPALSASGFALPRVPYEARSVLAAGARDPAPPKPPRDPPGSFLALYGFAGLVLVLALAAAALASHIVPAARALVARRRAAQAWRSLERNLLFLKEGLLREEESAGSRAAGSAAAAGSARGEGSARSMDGAAAAAFYAALARGFRLYLAARVLPSAQALTPAELRGLPEEGFPLPGLRDEAASILAEADAVRFGGESALRDVMLGTIERCLRLAGSAEESLLDRA